MSLHCNVCAIAVQVMRNIVALRKKSVFEESQSGALCRLTGVASTNHHRLLALKFLARFEIFRVDYNPLEGFLCKSVISKAGKLFSLVALYSACYMRDIGDTAPRPVSKDNIFRCQDTLCAVRACHIDCPILRSLIPDDATRRGRRPNVEVQVFRIRL